MPLIEVDQEVWDFLQEKARPLGMTSNDVLRTILIKKHEFSPIVKPPKVFKIGPPRGSLSQKELIPYIIQVLKENGGSAQIEYIYKRLFAQFQEIFNQSYYQQKVSRGIPRWQHFIAWAKERAKHMGLIESPSVSGRGVWKLSEKGHLFKI